MVVKSSGALQNCDAAVRPRSAPPNRTVYVRVIGLSVAVSALQLDPTASLKHNDRQATGVESCVSPFERKKVSDAGVEDGSEP